MTDELVKRPREGADKNACLPIDDLLNFYDAAADEIGKLQLARAEEAAVGRVTLTGHELKAALKYLAPDGDADQLDQMLVIEWWDAAAGRNEEAGYYAWHAEYPDEGCIRL